MRSAPVAILAIVGISLLSLQMSGLHMHVNLQGDDAGGLHAAHVHQSDTDVHDHSADFDVPVLDPGAVWSKVVPALLLIYTIVLAVVWTRQWIRRRPQQTLSQCRRSRWRPPLRAPPLSP